MTLPLDAAVLGYTGAGIGVVMTVPQVHRTVVRRQYAGLSLSACSLALLTGIAWAGYGLAKGSVLQIVANTVVTCLCLAVLAGLVGLQRPRLGAWLPLVAGGVSLVLLLGTSAPPDALGALATAVTVGGVVPQIARLLRDRADGRLDARGVAVSRWVMGVGCNLAWLGYGLIMGDRAISGCSAIMIVLSSTVIALARSAASVNAEHAVAVDA